MIIDKQNHQRLGNVWFLMAYAYLSVREIYSFPNMLNYIKLHTFFKV